MRLPRSITHNCCPCGAALEAGNRHCRKCRNRARWSRRRSRLNDFWFGE